jgi:hypothetical protein
VLAAFSFSQEIGPRMVERDVPVAPAALNADRFGTGQTKERRQAWRDDRSGWGFANDDGPYRLDPGKITDLDALTGEPVGGP